MKYYPVCKIIPGKRIINSIDAEFFAVYGKKEGKYNQKVTDFEQIEIDGEKFYPSLTNQYPGILCYKTKKVNIEDYFFY